MKKSFATLWQQIEKLKAINMNRIWGKFHIRFCELFSKVYDSFSNVLSNYSSKVCYNYKNYNKNNELYNSRNNEITSSATFWVTNDIKVVTDSS